ncbi:hypothetical protein [Campylobacter sp. RM16187]|uniref:hypothetical protein n=1 Tax=Campylobacter sp. RM16187 TaxID=1660063 RepID=UPI0021B6AA3A|nr:hypothetical protein [Campylobacter sp. RM16187]QKG29516.1 hypothetical protein CDOMF_1263 [Campylobacter sp. RM16187]
MRKILLVFLIIQILLFAKSDKLSDIPPAYEIYINLEPFKCDDTCLLNLVKDGLLHSFLARYERSDNAEVIQAFRTIKGEISTEKVFIPSANAEFKIAIIIPQDSIKSYAAVVSNSAIAYMIRQNANIDIKFYNIGNESTDSIRDALTRAKAENISYLITPFTQVGVAHLNNLLEDSMLAYIPTLHSSTLPNLKVNLIFGGIDYKEQIVRLLDFSNGKNAAFSDGSLLGSTLNKYSEELSGGLVYQNEIGNQTDLKNFVDRNSKINEASIFLNIPILKTSLLSSQLRVYDINATNLLSTQINYTPSIFKLTQPQDRELIYIANSLSAVDSSLDSNNKILGQDINFNWVGYSTSVGMDYIYTAYLNQNAQKLFSERVENSQVIYNTKILKVGESSFSHADATR